jgi:hypothetical protein
MKKPGRFNTSRAREENRSGLDSQTATLLDHTPATHYDAPLAEPTPVGRAQAPVAMRP